MEELSFNGINAATGDYLLPELSATEIAKMARKEPLDQELLAELQKKTLGAELEALGAMAGVDVDKLDQAGWGIVFAEGDDVDALKEALAPLLQLRKQQAGGLYREFSGAEAVKLGQRYSQFLAEHGMALASPAEPDKVPYYLLLVSGPGAVPYRFQYQLDVTYCVGRLHFETMEEYRRYADSVVAAEQGQVERKKRASFFGVQNPHDNATNLSAKHLVQPLSAWAAAELDGWDVDAYVKDQATKARLAEILNKENGPAFLFTASHGVGFPKGHARQRADQGAILCQDWPGPLQWKKQIPPEHYLSASDLTDDARVAGLIAFHFACYGAGTPEFDDFAHQALKEPVAIADAPFVARLPQALLAHPEGGALAVVGHVDRAWGYSFAWPKVGEQLGVFQSAIQQLLAGKTLGSAMDYFNARYAALSTELTAELGEPVPTLPDQELAGMWTANNDAKSYVIVGDPAVRVAVGG